MQTDVRVVVNVSILSEDDGAALMAIVDNPALPDDRRLMARALLTLNLGIIDLMNIIRASSVGLGTMPVVVQPPAQQPASPPPGHHGLNGGIRP